MIITQELGLGYRKLDHRCFYKPHVLKGVQGASYSPEHALGHNNVVFSGRNNNKAQSKRSYSLIATFLLLLLHGLAHVNNKYEGILKVKKGAFPIG